MIRNILSVPHNNEEIRHENQIILLMITDVKKWHYLAVKNLFALFEEIKSKHKGNFYCLTCLHSYRAEKKIIIHENVFENHDYYYIDT